MPRKSYVTSLPDKTGAFMLASKIIAKHHGNMMRVSYNKAVDLHTLFLDVEASQENLAEIERELEQVGYLNNKIPEIRVIVVEIKLPDVPGAVLPVLKIIDRYDISISYLNSSANETSYQNFKMGLLIENPHLIKMVLDDISEHYPIDIIDYDDSEKNLDNTIFYIRLANEMQKLLDLSNEKTIEFITESNRIFQMLQDKGETPDKVFDYIRRFAYFISKHRGIHFKADVEKISLSDGVDLYNIQPPCGSNTYVLDDGDELILIDTGYAIYADELLEVLYQLFPDLSLRNKSVYITHADVDHCGLLSKLEGVKILLNKKSADNLNRQRLGIPDSRETTDIGLGYSKLSRIISGYIPPSEATFKIMGDHVPEEHKDLLYIDSFKSGDLKFDVYEGSGGHLYGEMIFVCKDHGVAFTGDNLVNITDFSRERAEFNSLAPYLLRSVNVDSKKATEMRKQVIGLINEIGQKNQKPCIVCGGHGPISLQIEGKLIKHPNTEVVNI